MEKRRIKISTGNIVCEAELNFTKTAEKIWDALPFEGEINFWGDEIYFRCPVKTGEEDAKETVQLGDIAYWPPGSAFCIFFGKTPASRGDEIRPASGVNVFGKITGDPKVFKKARSQDKIKVEKIE